jgi:hypothetical protein
MLLQAGYPVLASSMAHTTFKWCGTNDGLARVLVSTVVISLLLSVMHVWQLPWLGTSHVNAQHVSPKPFIYS